MGRRPVSSKVAEEQSKTPLQKTCSKSSERVPFQVVRHRKESRCTPTWPRTPAFGASSPRSTSDILQQAIAKGCPLCGGPLHIANYERKPRGIPDAVTCPQNDRPLVDVVDAGASGDEAVAQPACAACARDTGVHAADDVGLGPREAGRATRGRGTHPQPRNTGGSSKGSPGRPARGCQVVGPDFRYLYLNESAAAHGRSTKQTLVGCTIMEAYPSIEGTPMFAVLKRCMEERIALEMENEFTYPDGSTGWFELRCEPVTAQRHGTRSSSPTCKMSCSRWTPPGTSNTSALRSSSLRVQPVRRPWPPILGVR